jgi:hypothetical protein
MAGSIWDERLRPAPILEEILLYSPGHCCLSENIGATVGDKNNGERERQMRTIARNRLSIGLFLATVLAPSTALALI